MSSVNQVKNHHACFKLQAEKSFEQLLSSAQFNLNALIAVKFVVLEDSYSICQNINIH